jgi:glycosyltransferase involved in cell wall biosynthesis
VNPKISVVTATYNSATTIREAVLSVAEQTVPAFEHIIIDGNSTDSTLDVVRACNVDGLDVFSEPDSGIYDALNKGIKKASGDLIMLLHSDDFLPSKDLFEKIQKLWAEKDFDVLYSDLSYVSSKNKLHVIRYWRAGDFNSQDLFFGWMPPHPTMFIKKEIYDKYGLFDTTYRISADYEFILRILSLDSIVCHYSSELGYIMRMGGESNRNFRNLLEKTKEDYRAASKYFPAPILTIIFKNIRKIKQFWSRD